MSNVTLGADGNNSGCITTGKSPVGDLDGYSLPVLGLADGTLYIIHVPAMTCICLSFICAASVISYSFYKQKCSTFFEWTKSERFVVYMALCDALFNMSHFCDHFHIVYSKSMPRPKSLCVFYAFMLAEFVSAQNLLVNIVAINVFVLIYFRKKLNFGRWDYRLLLYIFGVPGLAATVAAIAGQFGPNRSFCYFDGVRGQTTNIFFTTVPLALILSTNIVLYVLSWFRIYKETREIKDSLGKSSRALRASHKAAKTMSLFVIAFVIQWWALALYGIWELIGNVPILLFNFVTTFSNVGGILNGIVFVIITRRKREKEDSSAKGSVDKVDSGHHTQSTAMSGHHTHSTSMHSTHTV